jgi:site-specific DNA-methyltransferase (adenine-specific)
MDLENKIINDDCLNILKQLPDKCIDAIICDLPYGTTACSWDSIIPFDKLWEQYKRIRKDNTPIVLFGSEPFSTYLRMSNIKEFKYDLIWNKDLCKNPGLAKIRPLPSFEIISIFGTGKIKYNPQMEKGEPYTDIRTKPTRILNGNEHKYGFCGNVVNVVNNGQRYPKSVINIKNPNQVGQHPTQKPVKLLEYLIKTYSNESDLVLDNCSGSGTTAVACHNLNRRFICIEKDYDYWKASVERLENAKSQLNLFTNIEQPKEEITEQAKLF